MHSSSADAMIDPVTRWCTLPAYLVRMAGFAFERLEPLGCTEAAAAEEVLARAVAAAASAGQVLHEALGEERFAENPAFADPVTGRALVRRFKQARAFARDVPDAAPGEVLREVVRAIPRVAEAAAALEAALASRREAAAAFERAFAADLDRSRAALRRLYRDERLQEAVFLQSPEAFDRLSQLVADEGPRNRQVRRRERVAAMYAQRFCAKNETNSFCGPLSVGYLTDPDAGSVPGFDVVAEDARRETYFSHWAAQALLDEAVRRAGGAPHTLRLHPMARVEGGAVAWCAVDYDGSTFRRRHARSPLPEAGARLLRALERPRHEADLPGLAAELGLERDDLASFVEQLVAAGILLRGPVLAPGLFSPLRAVAAEVAAWPAHGAAAVGAARAWALDEVAALEALVAAFARAPLAGRIDALRGLAARFEAATGAAAARGGGHHYADRSLVHEDAYVEVRSSLGEARAALEQTLPVLAAALELPLELRRERVREWFGARFGEGVRVPALEVHRAFDEERVLETQATTPRGATLRAAIARVQAAIGRAVAEADGGEVRLSAEAVRDALAGVELPTHPAYVSVDALLRRRPGGGVDLVIGEVHSIFWLSSCLLDVLPPEHRDRAVGQMRAAVREMARGRPTAEGVFLHMQATDRRFPIADLDLQVLAPSERPGALDLSALDLRLADGEVEFWAGDEEIIPLVAFNRYELLYLFSRFAPMFDHHADRFFPEALLPEALRGGDAPRLGVDRLIVQRRTWRRRVGRVRAALDAQTEAEMFRGAQALRRELGCGRHVFAAVPGEPKPVLLDFHDVFLLEALGNLLTHVPDDTIIKISEMLPGPDELVARGPDGLRTSELRLGFYRA